MRFIAMPRVSADLANSKSQRALCGLGGGDIDGQEILARLETPDGNVEAVVKGSIAAEGCGIQGSDGLAQVFVPAVEEARRHGDGYERTRTALI
jgi:hypothetical protein